MLKDNIYKFLQASASLTDRHTLYLCDYDSCLVETGYNYQNKHTDFPLSDDIKEIFKTLEKIYRNDGIVTNIKDGDKKQIYPGFMISKINEGYFLITTDLKNSLGDSYGKFSETTIYFLNEMLKDAKQN